MTDQEYYQEILDNREKFKVIHAEEFKAWLAKRPNIKTIPELNGFKVGDRVTFTNEYGVVFPGHTILAIDADASFYGCQFYLDYDCYWFPAHPDSLTKED